MSVYITDPDAIRQALIQQLTHPVRWVETFNLWKNMAVEIHCGMWTWQGLNWLKQTN